MPEFFEDVKDRIGFAGAWSGTTVDLAFEVYDPDRMVLGKRMEDHLRMAACYWHSFNWPGSDVFGAGTFDRPWSLPRRTLKLNNDARLSESLCTNQRNGPDATGHTSVQKPPGATAAKRRKAKP